MLDLTTIGHTVYAYLSTEKIAYKYFPATEKTNAKGGKNYTAIRNAKEEEISIRWHDSEVGQHLTLWKNDILAATFTLTNDKQMMWQPQEIYSIDQELVAKPSNPNNVAIVSTSLYNFFQTWLNSKPFAMYLDSLSREQVYPPSLVKLLLLYISYLNIRTKTAQKLGGKLTEDLDSKVDKSQVAKIFNILLSQVVGDTPHMVRMYSDANSYLLPASTNTTTVVEPVNQPEIKTKQIDAEVVEVKPVDPRKGENFTDETKNKK